ncbi:hypothetical protein HK097_006458 [Rhizophlyctis rosea]|uniref:RGS domain-containing protein n=1 Tax=Rhizophlyctis rosea TaxID=64517 RepID=A0AAD5SFQ5_9FUNG|nr:hypothetical protein HK097_006458 [Rhizophlyctis rosea]
MHGAEVWLYPTVDELARKEFDLDSILSGKTYEPIGIKDFNRYVTTVEHSAENLHFYFGYLNYNAKFAKLSSEQSALSPPPPKSSMHKQSKEQFDQSDHHNVHIVHDELRADTPIPPSPTTLVGNSPPGTSARSINFPDPSIADSDPWSFSDATSTSAAESFQTLYKSRSAEARAQPLREEFDRLLAVCILPDSPKELNLPAEVRAQLLKNAETTTHPDVLRPAAQHIYSLMATTTYPNFMKYATINSNKPRQVFAVSLVSTLVLVGLVIAAFTIAKGVARPWRLFSILAFFLAALIGGFRGGCVCIYGLGYRRQLKPDELWLDLESNSVKYPKSWNWRVFEKEVRIEEAKLRKVFDKVFLNALLGAVVVAGITAAIVMSIPPGHM